jgi:hypothetical protein
MGVSANTLFHFTSAEALKSILISRHFLPSYSLEHFDNILPETSIYQTSYVPLVSFCDLTITQLSQISRHTDDFGKFGIGLKKEWGESKGISPVVYVHNTSYPSKSIYNLITTFNSKSKSLPKNEFYVKVRERLIDFFKFIKPYNGYWQKNKKLQQSIRYYDEREWRYSPTAARFKVYAGKKRSNEAIVNRLSLELKKHTELSFDPDDIKFIIIDQQADIEGFFRAIDRMKVSANRKRELKTRIITFDEIREDY